MTEHIVHGRAPEGSQIQYGKKQVMSRFKDTSILFAVDRIVHGVMTMINRTFASFAKLLPIPVSEDVSSLSAILLDEGYYDFIKAGTRIEDSLPIIGPECLIPMKAKAYIDLSERKAADESIDSKDIKKHKNDIFRLFTILDLQSRRPVPKEINLLFIQRTDTEGDGACQNLLIKLQTQLNIETSLKNFRTNSSLNNKMLRTLTICC